MAKEKDNKNPASMNCSDFGNSSQRTGQEFLKEIKEIIIQKAFCQFQLPDPNSAYLEYGIRSQHAKPRR